MPDASLTLAGEDLRLLPERAAYWVQKQTLIVADLHWAKSEALQRCGVPLPSGALDRDLTRLALAARRLGAKRIMVLGDLVHTPFIDDQVSAAVALWRRATPDLELALIRGNHDRALKIPASWQIRELLDQHLEGPFCFTHGGENGDHGFADSYSAKEQRQGSNAPIFWAGHIHPSISLKSRRDRLRLSCFLVNSHAVWLPAFGSVTGSFDIQRHEHERVFVIAEDSVLEV